MMTARLFVRSAEHSGCHKYFCSVENVADSVITIELNGRFFSRAIGRNFFEHDLIRVTEEETFVEKVVRNKT